MVHFSTPPAPNVVGKSAPFAATAPDLFRTVGSPAARDISSETSDGGKKPSFLDLPLELRCHVYSYLFDYHPSNPKFNQIELTDERWFNGSPVHICLLLGWPWLLLNRQIAREGVDHAFRSTNVRWVGGPWVLWRTLSKIGNYTEEEQDGCNERRNKGKEKEALPVPDPLLHGSKHESRTAAEQQLYHPPYYNNPENPFPSLLTSNRLSPTVSLLSNITILWPTPAHDIGNAISGARIATFELRPLFELLSRLPHLRSLTIGLRSPPRSTMASDGPREIFNALLAIYSLCLVLHPSSSLHTVNIRYAARNPYAAMDPALPFPIILRDGIWALMRRGKLEDLKKALDGVEEMGFEVQEEMFYVRMEVTKWDPLCMTDMVGDELLITLKVKENWKGRYRIPNGGPEAWVRLPDYTDMDDYHPQAEWDEGVQEGDGPEEDTTPNCVPVPRLEDYDSSWPDFVHDGDESLGLDAIDPECRDSEMELYGRYLRRRYESACAEQESMSAECSRHEHPYLKPDRYYSQDLD